MNLSNNPVTAAGQLRAQLGWQYPEDFTLEEVANFLRIFVKSGNISSEGRIVMKSDTGIITIREDISLQSKKNFIIAHEIAHFCLHKNLLAVFTDTHKTLSDWYRTGLQEQEANQFASALLMPETLFRKRIDKQKLSVALIREVSAYFVVSMTAAFLKYVDIGRYPLMVIFIENGIVKWKKHSTDFPYTFLELKSRVPAYTVAGDYFIHGRLEEAPEKIAAIEWFPDDFKCQKEPDTMLWEQCFQVSEYGLISCLWV